MYADMGVKPAETTERTVPGTDQRIDPTKKPTFMNLRTRRNNTMHLLNEALARARMRELWRDERRGYKGRHRGARDIDLDVQRRRQRESR